jgi:hypothetical protein
MSECKTKQLVVKYGFSSKAESMGSRCKIHFLDIVGKAKCNPKMNMLEGFGYEHEISYLMYGNIFPCDVCLTCLKKRIAEGAP